MKMAVQREYPIVGQLFFRRRNALVCLLSLQLAAQAQGKEASSISSVITG